MKIRRAGGLANRPRNEADGSAPQANATLGRSGGRRWLRPVPLVAGAIVLGLGVIAGLFYSHCFQPLLPVPVPKDLSRLEPQLRAYVVQQVQRVQEAPRDPVRRATLGMVYAANGLWLEAQAAFSNVVQMVPQEPLAQLYLAVSFQELGAVAEAARRFRLIAERFPQFAPGFYRLGDALLRAGSYDAAAAAFQRLRQLAPGEWRGWAGLGECRLRQGQADEAAKLLEAAVRLAPKERLPHHLLGQAYQRLGQTAEAERELRLGLDAPHYPMPDAWSVQAPRHMRLLPDLIEIANDFVASGQPAEALRVLSQALAYNPTNLTLMNQLAGAFNQAGRPQQAKTVLLKVLELDPRNLAAHVALVTSCLAMDQKSEALQQANQALEINANQVFPHLAKANALLALERDAEAAKELEAAIRCDPQNAQLHLDLGDICLRNLSQPAEALAHFRRATELDPTLAPALRRLADLDLRLGNTNEAKFALQALRQLTPDNPELRTLEQRLAGGASSPPPATNSSERPK